MTRQHTPLSQRFAVASPGKKQQRSHAPTSRTVSGYKSPLQLGTGTRGIAQKLASRRVGGMFLKNLPALPTIEEEDEEELVAAPQNKGRSLKPPAVRAKTRLHRRGMELEVPTDMEDDEEMDWDEESTLIALLKDDRVEEDDQEDLSALVEQLKAPMDAQSVKLRQYMAETIFPVVRRVQDVHEVLEDEVDLAYGTGLLAFDEVCKRVEALALRTEDETRTGYLEAQKEMKSITAQLVEAYRRRDDLWADLEQNLAACASRARQAVENVPQAIEDTITKLEKKNKDMEKNGNSASAKQKMLRDLLGRL